ncbi:CU044_5270 family protein [Nonomuraea sp. NPDC049695]|uniref:CU044_5270 family protein n=1 Tax=Nonomuraea sp. NPDC049695 TaxID=3154734 RepID=UPI003429131B
MDELTPHELTQVRGLYDDLPPDPFAKARIEANMRARTRRRFPWKAGVVALTATAALAAAIMVGPALLPPEQPARTTLSGHSILLAAATKAESAPTGEYWHVKRLYTIRPDKLHGKNGNTYRLESSRLVEQWVSDDGRAWTGLKELPARPLDQAAWRRDGAPTEWKVEDGRFSMSEGESRLTPVKEGGAFRLAGEDLTLEQVKALPTDPAALKERVLQAVRAGVGEESFVADGLPITLASLLYELPASPDVRAAAYRALADLPTVTVEEDAKDPRGRAGVAVTFPIQHDKPTRGRLIVDPSTSMVLSYEVTHTSGMGQKTEVVLAAGWTDTKPSPPTAE